VNNLFNINLGKFNEMFTGFFSNFITRCCGFPDKTRTKSGQDGGGVAAGASPRKAKLPPQERIANPPRLFLSGTKSAAAGGCKGQKIPVRELSGSS
jgi:hypothetical protein